MKTEGAAAGPMPTQLDVSLRDVEDAAQRIRGVAWPTPLLPASRDDDKVWVKMECLQRTGSFKIRGAWNRMSRCTAEERSRGFVAASAGNHGQAVAWSARRLGATCTVWVPDGAVARKVDAMKAMGAVVRSMPHSEMMDAMRTLEFPRADGATYIHPFGDLRIIAGQGTVGLEIVRDLPDVATILVPVGGGGLVVGIAAAAKALRPGVRVLGVQAAGADPLPRSWEAGTPQQSGPAKTLADGIGATRVFDYMWPLFQRNLDGVLRVTDEEILAAVAHLARESHVIAEGAGAAALAAALRERDRLPQPIVAVSSGGNVDPSLLARALA